MAVLDVAFTSYLTSGDVFLGPVAQSPKNFESERSPALTQPPSDPASAESLNKEDREAAPSTDIESRRSLKIATHIPDKRVRKTLSYQPQTVTYTGAAFDCRTVTYPFIGTSYYVRVTDDLGCLPNDVSRSRNDSLIARSLTTDSKAWRRAQDISSNLR